MGFGDGGSHRCEGEQVLYLERIVAGAIRVEFYGDDGRGKGECAVED